MQHEAPENLHAYLTALARDVPDRAALIACDSEGNAADEIPYRELSLRIASAAAYLQELGLGAGDSVALALETGVEHLIALWAAWSAGIVAVPLDLKRDTQELREYKMGLSGAKRIITTLPKGSQEHASFPWAPDLSHRALILFTSGTTARPKGVPLTLNNLIVNAQSIREWLRITAQDRFLVQLPFHHINSTTFSLATLLAGGTIIVPPAYSNSHFWLQAANTKATFTSVVPSIVFDQLQRKSEHAQVKDALALTRIQIGSAPVVAEDVKEFIGMFGIPLYQGYGQTETALRVTGVPLDLAPALLEKVIESNSIGTAMPWADIAVMDEEGACKGENEEGELAVKGSAVMEGYLSNEPAFRDGYFLTGDVGYYRMIEGKKFFYLKGRKKEIIIKGGVNISPVAVENSLKKISDDIDQAYVIGLADARYGEEVAAAICFRSGVDAAGAMRRLKLLLLSGTPALSAYETPQYLAAISAQELPMTSTGKVQRAVLKNLLSKERWESLCELFETASYRFMVVRPRAPLEEASHALYNHCWQPLRMDGRAYRTFLQQHITLAAADALGALAGEISFTLENGVLTCTSICSAAYEPKPVPRTARTPAPQEVKAYLLGGNDPVMNFHARLGAELVEVVPGGRPEDASSLGYTMRLRYVVPAAFDTMDASSVADQLIRVVLMLGRDLRLSHVYALSRPGGLASYLAARH